MPLISPTHQSSLTSRPANASMIQKMPTIRNRNPRMSASAANVFSGLVKASTAAPRNSTPKMANSHFPCSAMPASMKFCIAAPRNRAPTMTPTVVIEA